MTAATTREECEVSKLNAALACLDASRDAHAHEDERFAAWMKGEAHGNSVRAAERKSDDTDYAAIKAVSDVSRDHEEIAVAWGYDEVRAAIMAVRDRLAERSTR